MTIVKDKEIEKACSILFGDSFSVEKETIEYLQLSGIKHAFRTKVKECHPDLTGNTQNPAGNDSFLKLKDAYDFLISVKSEKPIAVKSTGETRKKASGTTVQQDRKPLRLPRRKLKLGEYLYYSGKISWEELIAALTWQRQSIKNGRRALFGSYFTLFNIMSSSEMGFAVFKMNVHNANYQNR